MCLRRQITLGLKVDGVLLTLADMRINLARATADNLRQNYGRVIKVYQTVIPFAVKATASAVKAIIAGTKALVSAIAVGGWVAVLILIIVLLFGGILCMVGGGNSNTVSPVSEEVETYESVIRIYARKYGIEEYVELIKAVMMQESGGVENPVDMEHIRPALPALIPENHDWS